MFQVDVSPDMAMYNLLRSQGYDPAYALAEFIDNALHAHQEQLRAKKKKKRKSSPLSVCVKFYSPEYREAEKRNSILVSDDGPGISRAQLPEALKPARHKESKGLSEFGIGMKAAAVWFTDSWGLVTRADGEKFEYKLDFDLNKLLSSGGDLLNVEECAKAYSAHGTDIQLKNIRRQIDKAKFDDICSKLIELYQRFTAGSSPLMELKAYYDGTPRLLQFVEPASRQILHVPKYVTSDGVVYAVGEDKTWSIPISTEFNGYPVEGQILILEKGSYKTNPGLVLFRNGRVIRGTMSSPYIPPSLFGTGNKYARQRVYGELHLDHLPVSYTKDNFEFDETAFLNHIKKQPGVDELFAQAENFRVKGPDKAVLSEAHIPTKGQSQKSGVPSSANSPAGPASPQASPPSSGGSSQPTSQGSGASAGQPAQPSSNAPGVPATSSGGKQPAQQRPLVMLLEQIKPKAKTVALRSIIEETLQQCKIRRDIGSALCFRLVLELGVITRIEADFPSVYPKVSDKGIAALIRYMHGNNNEFFDPSADHRVIKCIQSLMAVGAQNDVLLLNNVAHGHYHPNQDELDRAAKNLEQLIRWAYP